jgi:hypothetical protein
MDEPTLLAVAEAIKAEAGVIKMKARLADFGGTVLAGSPADFGRLIADETEKWAKVVKFAGAALIKSRTIFRNVRSANGCPSACELQFGSNQSEATRCAAFGSCRREQLVR